MIWQSVTELNNCLWPYSPRFNQKIAPCDFIKIPEKAFLWFQWFLSLRYDSLFSFITITSKHSCTCSINVILYRQVTYAPLAKSTRMFSCTITCCRDDIQPIKTSSHRSLHNGVAWPAQRGQAYCCVHTLVQVDEKLKFANAVSIVCTDEFT